ncbi:mycofactocin biosynthesis chaperone MftB [Microbacterium sp. zg.B48]|uniref:mycofactocin biosynthesis chaperone MftB n=1 Tax=unclassified Microbacterium TaxID=2609290 RepID=UPI00214BFB4E|nr:MULTISPECIES: mycofactocin biosynthesis chaperone MftB [unclassified Microbacterium]MCR2765058.1 mycofactocin biosynthesis chaperone MftB [Microbacterium sp. zg.B48]MCR2811237.1 mycofactocin biosynthesis chaperone MftB [Microbacterium sp. zg.B185]WIM19836.1 mycofactocin biosynthesis chaperone MftB [Microbacterium sp. zg-B185]
MTDITPDSVLRLHNRVSVRPEPFGALLYHFGTRRLSFLKSPALLAVVDALTDDRTVADALGVAAVPDEMRPAMLRAITTLRDSDMLVEVAA